MRDFNCYPKNWAEKEYIQLLKSEISLGRYEKPVSTITFFDGKAPVEILRIRIEEILNQNRWLTGSYCKHPQTKEYPVLSYAQSYQLDKHFHTLQDQTINSQDPYALLIKKSQPYLINKGKVGRPKGDFPLFKVTILEQIANKEQFAIIVSSCHTLTDGKAFYLISNMLSQSQKVQKLTPERVDATKEIQNIQGKKKHNWLMSALYQIPTAPKLFLRRYPSQHIFLNEKWISDQKRLYKATQETPYISTNDILSSAYFRLSQADCGIMAVDPRGKVKTLKEKMAGYYAFGFIYFKDQFKFPASIRQVFDRKNDSEWDRVPGLIKTIFCETSLITNWSGFDSSIELKGTSQRLHVPIYRGSSGLSSAIIWQPKAEKLGLFFYASKKMIKRIVEHPMFAGYVFDENETVELQTKIGKSSYTETA